MAITVNKINPVSFSLRQSSIDEKKGSGNKRAEKLSCTVGEVFNDSLKDKIKDWIKVFRYTATYVEYFNPNAPEAVHAFGSQMSEFKNFLSIRELYKKTQAVYFSLCKVAKEPVERSVISVFGASTDLMSSVVDSLNFASRFVYMNASVLKLISKNTDMAKFACAILSTGKDSKALAAVMGDEHSSDALIVAHMLRLAVDISYIALGIFSIGFSAVGLAPSAIVLTSWSAFATVISLISYFQDKMCDPYQKKMAM